MKICTICRLEKKESEFFFRNKVKGILHSNCKECKRKIDSKAYKENLTGRSDRIRLNATNQIEKAKEFILSIKKESKCNCGENRFWVLDFHHLSDKTENISRLVRNGASLDKLKKKRWINVLLYVQIVIEIYIIEMVLKLTW